MPDIVIAFGRLLGLPILLPIMMIDYYLLGEMIPWPRSSGDAALLQAVVGWIAWLIIIVLLVYVYG